MKKTLLLTLIMLLAIGTLMHAVTIARYTGSRIYWDSRTPVTVFSGGGYARLIELQDGRLLACCESGGIKISFSSNKGSSWTSPTLIAPNPNKLPNCVPDLIQLADGTIIVAYNPRPSSPYSSDRRFGIRLRRSTNNGRTWSDEIFVYDADSTFENGCWEPSLLELPSGELQLYFADESPYTQSGEQQISLCRSFDGGLTWSAPQRVSFRSGYRDGMPVPVLLADGKTICVAIEDNGWSGVGDFVPTTVRVPLTNNWKNGYYINGTSTLRNRSVNHTYCPVAKGGAPYLRVLPNGETVLSHQSKYGDGDNNKMYVYVGNQQAKDFKAMSRPLQQDNTKNCLWNSLAVIDTGVVVAVGGLGGKIVIAKGYPMHQFLAPYSTPQIDGRFNADDVYYNRSARQVPMGWDTGTFSYTDFAYDLDSLYMTCLVYRKSTRTEEPFADGVTFYVDNKGASTNVPMATSFRLAMLPDGTLVTARGNGKGWTQQDVPGIHCVGIIGSQGYRLEAAIPWSSIGLTEAPVGKLLTVNIEVNTGDGTKQLVERIPDASPDKPATWVPLSLIKSDATPLQPTREEARVPIREWGAYDMHGRPVADGRPRRGIIVEGGKKTLYN